MKALNHPDEALDQQVDNDACEYAKTRHFGLPDPSTVKFGGRANRESLLRSEPMEETIPVLVVQNIATSLRGTVVAQTLEQLRKVASDKSTKAPAIRIMIRAG